MKELLNQHIGERAPLLGRITLVGPWMDIDYNLDVAMIRDLKWQHGREEKKCQTLRDGEFGRSWENRVSGILGEVDTNYQMVLSAWI